MRHDTSRFDCTDAQWAFIKRLMNEAFVHHCNKTPNLDVHHMPRCYSKEQASADIKALLNLKANNWRTA
jgi:hypothetical protein